jgi:preprotein translocase subunit SecE
VARNTRQQRRARRREAAEAGEQSTQAQSAAGQRGRARQPQVRAAEAAPRQPAHEPRQRFRFIREAWAELNKVEWPGRSQVLTGSVVVIIACAIVGAYLWIVDLGLQRLVERVLL